MRKLIGGLTASLMLWTLSAEAQVTDGKVSALVEALRQAAPKTGTANDGLYSEWQVKPEIIPSWSKQCVGRTLTPTQFDTNTTTARDVISCITRRELQKQYKATDNNESIAVRRVAAWWLTGDAAGFNNSRTAAYTQKVLKFYQQALSTPSDVPPSPSPSPGEPTPSPSPTPSPTPSPSPSPSPSP